MRHGVISWFLLVLFLAPSSLSGQQQDNTKTSLKETRRELSDLDRKTKELADEELKGRQAFVRVYYDWQKDFRAFRLVPVKLTGLLITHAQIAEGCGDIPETAVLAVVGSDQKDEIVSAVVGDFVFARPCRKNGIYIWPYLGLKREYKQLAFNDAFGNPIPNANAELLIGTGTAIEPRICIALGKLNDTGELKSPQLSTELRTHAFILSHPDYGTALVNPQRFWATGREHYQLEDIYTVPVVPIGTVADERTIRGSVLDTEGNPVKNAILQCRGVETSSGGRISPTGFSPYEAITDAEGQFVVYLPLYKGGDKQPELVPLLAEYRVKIMPPEGSGLRASFHNIKSGRASTIVLQPAKKKQFRTFLFEDESGPITDPNRLKNIELTYRTGNAGGTVVKYATCQDRTNPPLGTYTAEIEDGPESKFLGPIEVTEDSPEGLIFKPHPLSRCTGRVIHGTTGEPLRGAVVAADYMLALPKKTSLAPLEQRRPIYESQGAVRTDDGGRFEMSLPLLKRWMTIRAIEEDFLRTEYRISDSGGVISPLENITMRLFPAATVIVEPNCPGEVDKTFLKLRCWGDQNINPAWLGSAVGEERDGRTCITATQTLRLRETRSIPIPAGPNLNLTIYFPHHSKWAPITIPNVKLEKGQTLILGRRDFKPAVRVLVKIVNSANETLPGVAVCHRTGGINWSNSPPISNEQGIAALYIPPDSSGEFSVVYRGKTVPENHEEKLPYEVGGEEDRDRMYTFQLSDRMISDLFK